jgi:cell division initiation protein
LEVEFKFEKSSGGRSGLKLSPLEIKQQEFKKVMRGYDPVEVDTFLDLVGNEFEKLLTDAREYEKKIITLEAELNNFKEVESTLKQTLMNVQETSGKSLENSKKEAILMRREAELEVQKMIEAARRDRDTMKEEVITLRTQKQSLISRLRHVLTSQLELMDVLELDDADMSKLRDRTKKVFLAGSSNIKPEQQPNAQNIAKQKSTSTEFEETESETPETSQVKKEDGTNLFRDVFGDDMDTYIK